jgi:hypothetical protein
LAELVLASDAEKRERDRYAWEAWGQRLSVAEFVSREERLRAHPWARGMNTWLYVEDGKVLSSCETFRMDSFLDGRAGVTFGVASVYTEPELRGRGYAGKMMQLLPTQGFQAGILFSDVGDYYGRFGWRTIPAFERALSPAAVESAAIRLRTIELDTIFSRLEPPRARFLVWPSAAQLDWHRERERAYADLFGRHALPYAGARSDGGVIAWAADFKNEKLLILHLQADSADDVRALVAAAQAEAAAAKLQQVICWDVLAPWPEDLGDRRARSDSLPMVLPILDGSESWSFVPRGIWI